MQCDSWFQPNSSEAAVAPATPVTIRAAQVDDSRALADVLASSFYSQEGWQGWVYPLLRLGVGEDLRNRLRSPEHYYACITAAVHAGAADVETTAAVPSAVVGTAEIAWKRPYLWPLVGYDGPYISNLAVRSAYRRQGIAQKLLLACEDTARQWHCRTLYLHVLETNHPAQRLYRRLGYEVRTVESSWTHHLFGQPRQILMRKQLG